MKQNVFKGLVKKYNVPVPRYTSYPTVPFWDGDVPPQERWLEVVKRTFEETNSQQGLSVYVHLPFCESLCTYCGCNTRITKNHNVEESYIEALLAEWQIYLNTFGVRPIISELHLGGGTPTFFSPKNLKLFIVQLLENVDVHPDYEFSFEGHPNNTTKAHLEVLHDLGFRRVSYGIQDLDEKVQRTINRIQPYENVERATKEARQAGYTSVNFDLIYGLPYQTIETITKTIEAVGKLRPERIAFYSYAHVPWVKPGQRSYTKADLPANEEKRALYECGKELLLALGYVDIGMDHFALPSDGLYKAAENSKLHRNFMGYTTNNTELLIGLGASSISDAKYAYAQNGKKVEDYKEQVSRGKLPLFKGHFMNEEDLQVKRTILNLACAGKANIEYFKKLDQWDEVEGQLLGMADEGLIALGGDQIEITPAGRAFVRNICAVFDLKLRKKNTGGEQMFSKAI